MKHSINDLILYCVYNLEECTFEKLIKKCFDLFPNAFRFPGLSKWPDSRKLDRPLRGLRKKGFLIGDPMTSFKLTNKGKKKAKEIANNFRQKKLI